MWAFTKNNRQKGSANYHVVEYGAEKEQMQRNANNCVAVDQAKQKFSH